MVMRCVALLILLLASSLANGLSAVCSDSLKIMVVCVFLFLGSGVIDIALGDDAREMLLKSAETYNFSVTVPQETQAIYSAFVFQVHSDEHNVTLTNTSASCNSTRECVTTGNNVMCDFRMEGEGDCIK